MDPIGLADAWLQAVHRIQSRDDLLPKRSHDERTMTEVIERALRQGQDPKIASASSHRVDRIA
jgi:hypothetical protein